MKAARAGLAMVTFLSWMVNARTSSFIGRTLAGNRIGLTLRSVGSNSMFPLVLTCAKGSSVPNTGNLVLDFFGLLDFFFVSCADGEFWSFWAPCCVQDLGSLGVPPVGHALRAEVGGGITFVTSGENTSKFIKLSFFWIYGVFLIWKPYMLALAGQPSLHGYDACMVYWNKAALRRNCRLKQCETSVSPYWVFLFSRNPTKRFWGLI